MPRFITYLPLVGLLLLLTFNGNGAAADTAGACFWPNCPTPTSANLPTSTAAGLPAASSAPNTPRIVTDWNGTSPCNGNGGGATPEICVSNGTNWIPQAAASGTQDSTYTPGTSGDWFWTAVPASLRQGLDKIASRLKFILNYRYVTDYNTGGSTGGLQEAISSCATGITAPACKIVLPQGATLLTSGVTIGSLVNAVSSTNGLIIMGQGSGPTSTSNSSAGSVIAWNGATNGTTMISVLGAYDVEFRDLDIWGCYQDSSLHVAGKLVEVVGSNTGAPSHQTTFRNVVQRGCQNAAVTSKPMGYYVHGATTAPIAASGTATSASSTTLVDTSKAWTTNQFVGTCGAGNNLACYVEITDGKGINQIRLITAVTASPTDQLTINPAWTDTPDSTSKYQIYAEGGGDTTFDDQADFVTWQGGGSRDVSDCIRIFSNQSLLNKMEGFECAGYTRYGVAQFGGNVHIDNSYFGSSPASTVIAAIACAAQTGAAPPSCSQQEIRGNHFELFAGDGIMVTRDAGSGSDSSYGGNISGNNMLVLADPAPSSTSADMTGIKIDGHYAFDIHGNRFDVNDSTFGIAFYFGSIGAVSHHWAANVFKSSFFGGPQVTRAGLVTVTTDAADSNGPFYDVNLNGIHDAGEPYGGSYTDFESGDPVPSWTSSAFFYATTYIKRVMTQAITVPSHATEVWRETIAQLGGTNIGEYFDGTTTGDATGNTAAQKTSHHNLIEWMFKQTPTQGLNNWFEGVNASNGDFTSQMVNIHDLAGSWAGGDEGAMGPRVFIQDYWYTPIGTLSAQLNAAATTMSVTSTSPSSGTPSFYKLLGKDRLVVFTGLTPTAVTVTAFTQGTTNNGATWTISGSLPVDAANQCFALDATLYHDSSDTARYNWLKIRSRDSTTQFHTDWWGQGVNRGATNDYVPGYQLVTLALSAGKTAGRLVPCEVLDGNYSTGSVGVKAARNTVANGTTFEVPAMGSWNDHTYKGLSEFKLGSQGRWSMFDITNIPDPNHSGEARTIPYGSLCSGSGSKTLFDRGVPFDVCWRAQDSSWFGEQGGSETFVRSTGTNQGGADYIASGFDTSATPGTQLWKHGDQQRTGTWYYVPGASAKQTANKCLRTDSNGLATTSTSDCVTVQYVDSTKFATIAAAVDSCGTGNFSGECHVVLPDGTITESSDIILGTTSGVNDKSGLVIEGQGSGVLVGKCATTLKVTSGQYVLQALSLKNTRFKDLCIDATTGASVGGLLLDAAPTNAASSNLSFENVSLFGPGGSLVGISLGSGTSVDMSNILFIGLLIRDFAKQVESTGNPSGVYFEAPCLFVNWGTNAFHQATGSLYTHHCQFIRNSPTFTTYGSGMAVLVEDTAQRAEYDGYAEVTGGIFSFPAAAPTTRAADTTLSGTWVEYTAGQTGLNFHHGGHLNLSGLEMNVAQTGSYSVTIQNDSGSRMFANLLGASFWGSPTFTLTPTDATKFIQGPAAGPFRITNNDGTSASCWTSIGGRVFEDRNCNGIQDSTEGFPATNSASASAFLAYFGDGSSVTTGTAVCAAQKPALTCVTNSVRTIATPGTTAACSTVQSAPFLVSCN